MAKPVDYKVTLYPACTDRGFISTTINLFGGDEYPEREITAAGMPDLISQVTAFANEDGSSCRASVKCLARRKPPGFKAATENLCFNLKTKEEVEAEKETEQSTALVATE